MNKIEEIFTAWRISFNPSDAQSDLASERIQICDACEFKEMVALGPVDIFTRCKICGCALKAKIYTPITYRDPGGSCPHGKWENCEREWIEKKDSYLISTVSTVTTTIV
jgi:hypothetical protein